MTSKICNTCKESKDINEFGKYKLKSGTIHMRGICNTCRALKQREYYSRNTDKINALVVCECGSLKPAQNLARHRQTKIHKLCLSLQNK